MPVLGVQLMMLKDQINERGMYSVLEQVKGMDLDAVEVSQVEMTEGIISDLERGDVPLEMSIRIYERGEKLKSHCDRLLSAAEDKVEKIKLSRAGKPSGTEPLDPA